MMFFFLILQLLSSFSIWPRPSRDQAAVVMTRSTSSCSVPPMLSRSTLGRVSWSSVSSTCEEPSTITAHTAIVLGHRPSPSCETTQSRDNRDHSVQRQQVLQWCVICVSQTLVTDLIDAPLFLKCSECDGRYVTCSKEPQTRDTTTVLHMTF